jgi:hypothetical protein
LRGKDLSPVLAEPNLTDGRMTVVVVNSLVIVPAVISCRNFVMQGGYWLVVDLVGLLRSTPERSTSHCNSSSRFEADPKFDLLPLLP